MTIIPKSKITKSLKPREKSIKLTFGFNYLVSHKTVKKENKTRLNCILNQTSK
jgi:hypothetical protein